jgi:hypothetical protein
MVGVREFFKREATADGADFRTLNSSERSARELGGSSYILEFDSAATPADAAANSVMPKMSLSIQRYQGLMLHNGRAQ